MNEQTKLTLRVDKKLINFAKNYSAQHDKSLSKIVSEYFALLAEQTTVIRSKKPAKANTPLTLSLIGVLRSKHRASEKDYKKYLEDKYL